MEINYLVNLKLHYLIFEIFQIDIDINSMFSIHRDNMQQQQQQRRPYRDVRGGDRRGVDRTAFGGDGWVDPWQRARPAERKQPRHRSRYAIRL